MASSAPLKLEIIEASKTRLVLLSMHHLNLIVYDNLQSESPSYRIVNLKCRHTGLLSFRRMLSFLKSEKPEVNEKLNLLIWKMFNDSYPVCGTP